MIHFRSLSFKLYLIIVPATILSIVLVSYVDSRVASNLLDRDVKSKAGTIATQLAIDLARLDPSVRTSVLRVWLGQIVETNFYIARIEVYQLRGDSLVLLATTSSSTNPTISVDEMMSIRRASPMALEIFEDREPYWKIIIPFSNAAAGTVGCVSVISSLSQSELVAKVHDRIDLFLIPISVTILVLLLHFLFTRVLTRRISRLGEAMALARKGDLTRRAPVVRRDELGTIALLFNETMNEIERSSEERNRLLEEQKNFNEHLQTKVSEATRDLSSANLQLSQVNNDLIETQRRLTQHERMAVAGQMAAAFAHEVGSPLSAITTHLELMAEEPGCGEETRRRVQLIQEQISRITGFVEELLSETRAASQAYGAVQVNDILRQLVLFLGQHLDRQKIQVETRFDPSLPEIRANAHQLQQVFLNLLNNAADAMPGGGKIVIGTETDSGAADGSRVAIAISDTGVGMAREEQARIFEPFFSTKDFRRGTGLGLSIAARIVKQHEGEISLESEPGAGTTFRIRFPALPKNGNTTREDPAS